MFFENLNLMVFRFVFLFRKMDVHFRLGFSSLEETKLVVLKLLFPWVLRFTCGKSHSFSSHLSHGSDLSFLRGRKVLTGPMQQVVAPIAKAPLSSAQVELQHTTFGMQLTWYKSLGQLPTRVYGSCMHTDSFTTAPKSGSPKNEKR